MKKITYLIAFLFILYNANGQTRNSKIAQKGKITKSENRCTTKWCRNPDSEDSLIIKTCKWHNFKFIETGYPDYRGRYSYEYEVFAVNNGKEKKINNSDIFNDKISQLEKLINQRVKHIFDDYAKDPKASVRFKGEIFKKIEINEMGISFSEDEKIEFNVSFGLGNACLSVDEVTVSFSLNEINEYLR